MRVKIYPSRAAGEVFPPPSKSMAHRFLICAGLADGESTIRNVALSEDILATIDCLKALGAQVNENGESISVKGAKRPFAAGIMPCRESGSTLRFFIPICLLDGKRRVFKGSERLLSRPLSVYEDICREKCFEFSRGFGEITVSGRLCGGRYAVPGDISSQFISGLLFALPIVNGDSAIELVPPVESRPYIDMTLFSLSSFGVRAEWTGENELLICGGQDYSPADLTVEGDCSNAAFLAAMNLAGGSVRIKGLNSATLQGDRVYEEL
ncbi:MAG: 3-phosphoshikimate 1-carboxyvinyltransferase, partial [Clostridia bacterium]|nr:3-phosphoshikimate 1-carboxyvinyltransferase [Clostridia bacterium]